MEPDWAFTPLLSVLPCTKPTEGVRFYTSALPTFKFAICRLKQQISLNQMDRTFSHKAVWFINIFKLNLLFFPVSKFYFFLYYYRLYGIRIFQQVDFEQQEPSIAREVLGLFFQFESYFSIFLLNISLLNLLQFKIAKTVLYVREWVVIETTTNSVIILDK